MFSRALEEKFRRSFRSFQEFSGIPAAVQTLTSCTPVYAPTFYKYLSIQSLHTSLQMVPQMGSPLCPDDVPSDGCCALLGAEAAGGVSEALAC